LTLLVQDLFDVHAPLSSMVSVAITQLGRAPFEKRLMGSITKAMYGDPTATSCDACRVHLMHNPDLVEGASFKEMMRACVADPSLELLHSVLAKDIERLDASCRPCPAGSTSSEQGVCVPCPNVVVGNKCVVCNVDWVTQLSEIGGAGVTMNFDWEFSDDLCRDYFIWEVQGIHGERKESVIATLEADSGAECELMGETPLTIDTQLATAAGIVSEDRVQGVPRYVYGETVWGDRCVGFPLRKVLLSKTGAADRIRFGYVRHTEGNNPRAKLSSIAMLF